MQQPGSRSHSSSSRGQQLMAALLLGLLVMCGPAGVRAQQAGGGPPEGADLPSTADTIPRAQLWFALAFPVNASFWSNTGAAPGDVRPFPFFDPNSTRCASPDAAPCPVEQLQLLNRTKGAGGLAEAMSGAAGVPYPGDQMNASLYATNVFVGNTVPAQGGGEGTLVELLVQLPAAGFTPQRGAQITAQLTGQPGLKVMQSTLRTLCAPSADAAACASPQQMTKLSVQQINGPFALPGSRVASADQGALLSKARADFLAQPPPAPDGGLTDVQKMGIGLAALAGGLIVLTLLMFFTACLMGRLRRQRGLIQYPAEGQSADLAPTYHGVHDTRAPGKQRGGDRGGGKAASAEVEEAEDMV